MKAALEPKSAVPDLETPTELRPQSAQVKRGGHGDTRGSRGARSDRGRGGRGRGGGDQPVVYKRKDTNETQEKDKNVGFTEKVLLVGEKNISD